MSLRENIATNIISVLDAVTSPIELKKITREPFKVEELGDKQFPALYITTGDETREDFTLIEVIEETLDADRKRSGNAIETKIVDVSSDEGTLYPLGAVRIVVRVLYEFTRGTA